MAYGRKALMVQSTQPHATPRKDKNPFCPRCHYRTYPLWYPIEGLQHTCTTVPEGRMIKEVLRHANSIIANLHFYRVPPVVQAEAVMVALVTVLRENTRPSVLPSRGWKYADDVRRLLHASMLAHRPPKKKLVIKHGRE